MFKLLQFELILRQISPEKAYSLFLRERGWDAGVFRTLLGVCWNQILIFTFQWGEGYSILNVSANVDLVRKRLKLKRGWNTMVSLLVTESINCRCPSPQWSLVPLCCPHNSSTRAIQQNTLFMERDFFLSLLPAISDNFCWSLTQRGWCALIDKTFSTVLKMPIQRSCEFTNSLKY